MDEYRDLYRVPVSAGYYASSRYPIGYGGEGRSSYALTAGDPLYSTYTRAAALDAYAGYGAPVSYQPELMPIPQYSQFLSPRHQISPRRRPPAQKNDKRRPPAQNNGKQRLSFAESLTPKKKPFKKSQKGLHVENSSPSGSMRKQGSQRKPLRKEQKNAGKPQDSLAAALAKETEELHKLFRAGVDSGKRVVKPIAKQVDGSLGKKNVANSAGQKRKADEEKKGGAPPSKKKSRGKKRKFAKEKKQEVKKDEKPVEAPKAVKAEPAALTEEEKKAMELSLELQKAACKAVADFLGIPEKSTEPEPEVEKSESEQAAGQEAQEEKPAEAPEDKSEEVPKPPPALSPEEENELEEKGFNFFSKMLEENQDLRKLYLEKKDAGTFECLVCHSVDPETSKKFANLTNLVMHTSMRRQKRPEHRGYGKAICDILGWESLRAPKRPAKQAKDEVHNTKQVEAAGNIEEKQDGA